MPRPCKHKHTESDPQAQYFKPRGIPMHQLEEVILFADEIESVRLADIEGLYHEEAAERMKISRATFGRVLERAHGKIADALLNGKALWISGEVFAGVRSTCGCGKKHRKTGMCNRKEEK